MYDFNAMLEEPLRLSRVRMKLWRHKLRIGVAVGLDEAALKKLLLTHQNRPTPEEAEVLIEEFGLTNA